MNTVFEKIRKKFEAIVERFSPVEKEPLSFPTPVSMGTKSSIESPDTEVLVVEEMAILLPARVILYNDEIHTFDEVILQLVRATGCSTSEAEAIAFEVDSRGLATAFEGEMDRCLRVSSILEEIALHTSIEMS